MRQPLQCFSLKTLLLLLLLGIGICSASWATDVALTGPWSVQISGTTSTFKVEKISNNTTGGHSGSLRLELWAFDTPYAGGSQQGYHLADYQLQPLSGRTEYLSVTSPAVSTNRPAAGTWYMALLLTEYDGSRWIMRSYLLANSGQTYECTSNSCTTVVAPTSVHIGSNRSHFKTGEEDSMQLSARIEASANAGTRTDIYISVSLSGQTYYLDPSMQWRSEEVAAVTGFALTDVTAPDFYSIPSQILPAGQYTFHIGLTASNTPPTALRAFIAEGSTQVVYDDFPTITFPPVDLPLARVGVPYVFNFEGLPRSTQASLHFHFQLGTFGGFPPIGVVLAPSGLLGGTPKVAGNYRFAVCAVDESGNFGGSARSTCRQMNLTVEPPAPAPTPTPTPGPFLFANWTCNGSGACATIMGGPQGSTGMFCSIQDCDAWGLKTIPGGYACSTTASVSTPRIATQYANGQCGMNNVDF